MGPYSVVRRIRSLLGVGPTAIHHGHTYTSRITGERLNVISVGRWVEIERLDAERRPSNRVRKEVFIDALEASTVEHDPGTCPECDEDDV